jgi:putative ABC transport system permease protein
MISYGLWQRRYGGDPAVIGRTIELNRAPREIIGALPPGFDFPDPRTQVWYVFAVEPEGAGLGEAYLSAIGRLRRGATPEAAALDLQQLLRGIPGIAPDLLRDGGWRPTVEPLRAAP